MLASVPNLHTLGLDERFGGVSVPTILPARSAAVAAKTVQQNSINSAMLLAELLSKDKGNPRVAGWELVDTKHLFLRAKQRDIAPAILSKILQRVGRANAAIEQYAEFPGVRLWDSANDVYIVLTRIPDTDRLVLRTAYRRTPDSDEVARRAVTVRVR